ncbi:hypothetical protein P3X46_008169 [Hevea brasiliensis]|uniref:Flavoprotein pyridine nucleotide cytochrome reductase-like FAD-binding domain-containing protein n=1 Tax=Hevea brasiliensis TaxID=3981 RepID=A0ABQ9MIV6_HEVBR|nr:hypothetical protein P3X46_008169 [Hevea brasiliensis]
MDLEFLQTVDVQILLGVAVLAIGIGAFFLFSSKKPKGCLDPENFRDFKLVKLTKLSHNVSKFTFALPTPTSVLGLPIGQHISCRAVSGINLARLEHLECLLEAQALLQCSKLPGQY